MWYRIVCFIGWRARPQLDLASSHQGCADKTAAAPAAAPSARVPATSAAFLLFGDDEPRLFALGRRRRAGPSKTSDLDSSCIEERGRECCCCCCSLASLESRMEFAGSGQGLEGPSNTIG